MGETLEELQAELRRQKALASQREDLQRIHAERLKLKAEIQALKQKNSPHQTSAWDAVKSAGKKLYGQAEKLAVAQREQERQQKAINKRRKSSQVKNSHVPGFQETWGLFE